MDCPTEQTLIQNKLGKLAGVEQLEFNLINRILGVRHTHADTLTIEQAVASLGMQAEPLTESSEEPAAPPAPGKKHWWPLALSGLRPLPPKAFTSPSWRLPGWWRWWRWCRSSAVAWAPIKGWIALKNRNLNINALMSIAVTGAVLIGQWPEAAMVMFLFTVAELIESALAGPCAQCDWRADATEPGHGHGAAERWPVA